MDNSTIQEGKSTAIISYILIVGVLIAMSINSDTKNRFAAFHIRQALGLSLTFISLGLLISYAGNDMVTLAMWIFMSVLWTYGFITAIQGKIIPTPLLGNIYQKLLKSI